MPHTAEINHTQALKQSLTPVVKTGAHYSAIGLKGISQNFLHTCCLFLITTHVMFCAVVNAPVGELKQGQPPSN